ncbi:MAG: NADH-quinone oxidoreductase subunit NuoK [Thermomicrobiales bacterium]|jgi:NADH-quinone oxidoreductase subunit K|nr:NADH-quinone oxidoreductase subunit NuoK [Thermomicrobiales bacterium]
MGELTIEHFLVVSALLFVIGMLGVLTRKNILIIFMSIELMLNAVNLSLIAFSRGLDSMVGQVFAVFVITLAAAEAAIGLGLILVLSRRQDTVDVTDVSLMRE